MLDIDEITSHLTQFGAYELPRDVFHERARSAMMKPAVWSLNDLSVDMIQDEMKHLSQSSKGVQ